MKPSSYLFITLLLLSFSPALSANSDSLGLTQQWEKQTFPGLPQALVVDQMERPYIYLAAKANGLLIWEDQGNEMPVEVHEIPTAQLLDLEVMHLEQVGNYLFLALGNFFGTMPQEAGLAIVNVSNPAEPEVMDVWKADTLVKGSAFVKVNGDYAYLGAMSMGLVILNISQPDQIEWVSTYLPDIHFPEENPGNIQFPNARGMAIRDQLLYLCYDAGGLRVLDISDPANPSEIGRYINEEVVGKQQAYNNIILVDDLAYVAIDYCGFEVLDISSPDTISQVGWWNPWNCEAPSNLWYNSPGHTNQLAYDAEQEQVFLASGGSELSIIDVSVPDQPVLCSTFGAVGNQMGVWGLTLNEDRLFLLYINALVPFFSTWSGVKLLSLNQIETAIAEVVFVDPLEMLSCAPNPFRESTQLQFDLKKVQSPEIRIYDARGKVVWNQTSTVIPAGIQTITWDGKDRQGRDLPAGVYYFAVKVEGREYLQKLVKI